MFALAMLALISSCGSSPAGPENPPAGPDLLSPALGDSLQGQDVLFSWSEMTGASSYTLQIAGDSTMADSIELQTEGTELTFQPGMSGTYWWRVSAALGSGTTDWSETWYFYLNNPCGSR